MKEQSDEGWFQSINSNLNLIVERDSNHLKLLSGPNYAPSFQKGLRRIRILSASFGVNKAFQQYRMFALDRPLIPKYTRAKLISETTTDSGNPSTSSSRTSSCFSTPGGTAPPSTVSTRFSSASSGRPYSTTERRVSITSTSSRSNRSKSVGHPGLKKAKSQDSSRQSSADSGFSGDAGGDSKYILPPRITYYNESECYLMSLPRCEQFVTHLARNLKPMLEELRFSSDKDAKDRIHQFAPKLHRLAQEQVIAFPRSASMMNNSPRFQEFLRLAVENVVMRFVHDRVFPVICHLSKREDRDLNMAASALFHSDFSTDQLGLPEDFCVPLPAAVVEMASLDMRTTPLDKLTCLYDTVQQINVHIREAVIDARADTEIVTEDLPSPNDHDMVLLLTTVIIRARPMHLMSTLDYADLYAWAVPIDIIEVVKLVSSAAELVHNIQPKTLQPSNGKLKREVSMEEIIQLTDELSNSFDRRGKRLEPLKSALDLHRERFTQRLEQSTEDRLKKQEAAWARLDRCPTPNTNNQPNGRFRRGLLASIHTKLICSTDPPVEVVDHRN